MNKAKLVLVIFCLLSIALPCYARDGLSMMFDALFCLVYFVFSLFVTVFSLGFYFAFYVGAINFFTSSRVLNVEGDFEKSDSNSFYIVLFSVFASIIGSVILYYYGNAKFGMIIILIVELASAVIFLIYLNLYLVPSIKAKWLRDDCSNSVKEEIISYCKTIKILVGIICIIFIGECGLVLYVNKITPWKIEYCTEVSDALFLQFFNVLNTFIFYICIPFVVFSSFSIIYAHYKYRNR